ncbi:hypothetical protein FSP39_004585 [Pinctada imbricata]|uniref:Ig-like domain-containing protein n=1 Tax=Pinctada imbricata TaxID=66713 RepID=A0AA88XUC1_PINIB|nr:hypothetical protein FSP39_004585 [Pinctada imbricata]
MITHLTFIDKPTTPQISPTTVEAGRRETMTCTSTSTSTPSPTGQAMLYTWTVNNGTLSDPRFTTSGNTLTINPVRKADKDILFQCKAKENQGLSSDTTGIILTVHYPPQGKPVISYSTLTYITGSTVTISCSVTGDGNPKATWTWRCGNRIFNSGITNFTGRSNLTFLVTKADNNQTCTCTVSSSVGSYNQTSDPVTLDIRYSPQGKPVMSFSTMTYVTGNTVALSCRITEDGNPRVTWTWKCGSRTFNNGIITSVRQSNLTMVVTKTDNNQPCTCTASSSEGSYSQTSDPAILDIRYSPQGKPVMSYNTLTHLMGSNIVLSCSILEDGNPQATWSWKCGNRTFNSSITNSVGRSNLTFVATMADNNQPCTCTASSPLGSYSQTSDPAVLDIRCK